MLLGVLVALLAFGPHRRDMSTNPIRPIALAAASCGLALTLAACGDGGHRMSDHMTMGSSSTPTGTADAGDHGPADVTFATEMIPHHAQALSMVDMTRGRRLSPDVQKLAAAIKAAQTPEIETMSGWLRGWHETIPDTHMSRMPGMSSDAPGMMSDADMAKLKKAPGAGFEKMWLQMMVKHHTGAIRMAEREQADGRYQPAVALAGRIIKSQSAEITRMRTMLAR